MTEITIGIDISKETLDESPSLVNDFSCLGVNFI